MRVAPQIELTDEERAELMKLVRFKRTSVRLAQRARIVLLAAQGLQNTDIAAQVGIGRVQGFTLARALRTITLGGNRT